MREGAKRRAILCDDRLSRLAGAALGGEVWCTPISPPQPTSNLEVADDVDETALASVMRTVPLGAAVLAGSAVALLVLGYLLVYIFVFIPRGTVG